MSARRLPAILWITLLGVFVWSGIGPHDRFTWVLEVLPAILGAVLLAFTYRKLHYTDVLCVLVWLHAIILMIGGHYTYARVPLFDWIRDAFHLSRNHYDRVGHFMQGFSPAIIAREVLLKRSPLKPGRWLFFITTCIVLAFSAFYELIEWWVSLATGEAGNAFLGTQGDIWDTHWDMFMCLIGVLTSQMLLSGVHDRQLAARNGAVERGRATVA